LLKTSINGKNEHEKDEAAEEEVEKEEIEVEEGDREDVKCWQISPGHAEHNLWPTCSEKGIIAIGWDIGNLSDMNKETIKETLGKDKITSDVNSNFYFGHEIREGVIIIAKKGNSKEIYGIGVVLRNYYQDAEKAKELFGEKFLKYQHFIDVDWIIDFESDFGERLTVKDLEHEFAQPTVVGYKHYTELKVFEKLEQMAQIKSDKSLWGGRPDIILEKYGKDDKIMSVFIGEVKYTDDWNYAIQGLKELLEYMALIKEKGVYIENYDNLLCLEKI
jgi:hypothetical protein